MSNQQEAIEKRVLRAARNDPVIQYLVTGMMVVFVATLVLVVYMAFTEGVSL